MASFELLQGLGVHLTAGVASRAVGGEATLSALVENRFRHNGTGRVAGAKKQHVVLVTHTVSYLRPCSLMEASAADASRTISSGFLMDLICTLEPQQDDPPLQMSSGARTFARSPPSAMRGMEKSRSPAAMAMLR